MILFVHEQSGPEAGEGFRELDPVLVMSLDLDLFGSIDWSVQPGDRETALKSGAVRGAAT